MKQGLKTAVVYSVKPHQLGFCGPKNKNTKKILSDYLKGKHRNEKEIQKILSCFKVVFSYYSLIAKANKLSPFDQKVVESYWIGSHFLDKVKISDLKRLIVKTFKRPDLASFLNKFSRPHHSFHVLIVGSTSIVLKGKLLDLCRIGYGQILKVEKNKLIVKYKPLTPLEISRSKRLPPCRRQSGSLTGLIVKQKVRLGDYVKIKIDWNKYIIKEPKVGDWISFHWKQACQILTLEQVKNLDYYTKLSIKNANTKK